MTRQYSCGDENDKKVQSLCKVCGLCCDGSLFDKAKIKDDEDLVLVNSLNLQHISVKNSFFFILPCRYSKSNSCLIYHNKKRPNICSSFFCKLILQVKHKEIDIDAALHIIRIAREKVHDLKMEMSKFEELNDTPIKKLNKTLSDLKKKFSDEVLFRKKYGKVIIQNYSLYQIFKHFHKKKKTVLQKNEYLIQKEPTHHS